MLFSHDLVKLQQQQKFLNYTTLGKLVKLILNNDFGTIFSDGPGMIQ